jgi:hypothetical protein
MNPRPGARIWIPCEVKPGAFSDERMVRVSHEGGEWLGFVNVSSLRDRGQEGATHILGIVEDLQGNRFTARLAGDAVTSAPFLGSVDRVTRG